MNDKIYQVYIIDEWNNAYQIGFFNHLDDAIEPINAFLETYNVKLEKGDVHEFAGTFGPYFDTYITDILYSKFEIDEDQENPEFEETCEAVQNVMIRGFVFSKEELFEELKKFKAGE